MSRKAISGRKVVRMSTELVLFSETPPSAALLGEAGRAIAPGGGLVSYGHDRVRQFVDARQRPVLSVIAPRLLEDPVEARRLVPRPPERAELHTWTEMIIPESADQQAGLQLAAAVALLSGGELRERW